jgi:hypothetical protein
MVDALQPDPEQASAPTDGYREATLRSAFNI